MLSIFRAFLIRKEKLNPDTHYFRFQLSDPKEINFIPGQYLILRIGDKNRLYSIASAADKKNLIEILVKIYPGGLASEFLLKLTPGVEVIFSGPSGVFRLRENHLRKIFLATSTGIAPFLSMIRSKKLRFETDYNLFWGLRLKTDTYFVNELLKIRENSGGKFNFRICLSQETQPVDPKIFLPGRVQIGLEKLIKPKDFPLFEFYLCGGSDFVEDLRNYLEKKGVNKERILFERYI
ncbi:MAG: FAD-dependent oxidoreductase [Patescibacteria group bacterium]|nr:FAD-dependent oxidoreductase [Patescibacteria group bacterium]